MRASGVPLKTSSLTSSRMSSVGVNSPPWSAASMRRPVFLRNDVSV